jgi:hypothetical protein
VIVQYNDDCILKGIPQIGIVLAHFTIMMKTLLLNKILTMKKLLYGLGVVLFGVIITAFTLSAANLKAPAAGPFDDVVTAIKQGDASALSRYLDNTVEISMAGKSNSYSKAQAEIILKDFFSKNQVKTFELIHQVQSNNGSRVGIANVGTSGGAYRTSFFLQMKGGSMVLNELRFETK